MKRILHLALIPIIPLLAKIAYHYSPDWIGQEPWAFFVLFAEGVLIGTYMGKLF